MAVHGLQPTPTPNLNVVCVWAIFSARCRYVTGVMQQNEADGTIINESMASYHIHRDDVQYGGASSGQGRRGAESPVAKLMGSRGHSLTALNSGVFNATNKAEFSQVQTVLESLSGPEREELEYSLRQQCSAGELPPTPPQMKGMYSQTYGAKSFSPRHTKHHLPIAAFLVALLQIIIFLIGIGNGGIKHIRVNPWIGTDYATLRGLGASWPGDVHSDRHEYFRFFTALVVPVGLLRLVWDLVILHMIGARIERIHGSAIFLFLFLFGGFGGYALEALLVPGWLSCGSSPGLMALTAALLVDMRQSREKDWAATLDVLLIIGVVVMVRAMQLHLSAISMPPCLHRSARLVGCMRHSFDL